MTEVSIRAINGSDGNTSTTTSSISERKVSLVGYPGPMFATIHISALISTTISTIVSASLIIYLCGCIFRRKHSRTKTIREQSGSGKQTSDGTSGDSSIRKKKTNRESWPGQIMKKGKSEPSNTQHIRYFWKWNVMERFVLYLAACDIGFGLSHSIDHIYIYHFVDFPPELLCTFFGFLLHQFMVGQWFVVTICAISACSLVVYGKRLSLGRWDWRLFAFAFVFPLISGIFGVVYRIFGASGGWCFINVDTMIGWRFKLVITVFHVFLYGVVAYAYAAIWFKIRRPTGLLEGCSTNRYQNSARLMLIFVTVFVFQWFSFTVFSIWVLIAGNPPPEIFVTGVILVNFGGVYNCFAYTIIRRRLQKQAKDSGAKVVVVSALDRASTTAAKPVTLEDTTTEMATTTTGTIDSSKQHQTIRL